MTPLPLITELIDNMGGKRVFTKIDLRWGFNNVRIKEGDEWKGAFTKHIGSFEPTVMFFGMTNSPATFQAMMSWTCRAGAEWSRVEWNYSRMGEI